ncbi:FadR/GntR family transcriptional regulator [Priestia megaterium]|uniref:FCD domain-containing protein n=1 Tax=Priestia megaterium TaxID=1404 RepID=A0A6M6E775_PRIMG|nr:FadR/GntR family transcriptional regulator [Priestia megaterium]QJX81336.1 FCD domain-containing protein [Priestia megaterium]
MSTIPKKTFMDIVQYIKDSISNGKFLINTKIPSERLLAEELKTSRVTIREALRALESLGIVESKVGQGTFVKNNNFTEMDGFSSFTNQSSPTEVFMARFAIEPFLAELATRNATQEDLVYLKECLQKMETSLEEIELFEKLNTEFHYRIALAAKSSLLLSFIDIIENIHTEKLWGTLRARSLKPDKMQIYHKQHIAIYEAINERDSEKAKKYTLLHLKTVRNNMLEE